MYVLPLKTTTAKAKNAIEKKKDIIVNYKYIYDFYSFLLV